MIKMTLFHKKEVPLVTLETERLKIVPLSYDEFMEKRKTGFGDKDFTDAMNELLDRAKKDRRTRFAWYTNRMIYRKEDGACIGSIACMNSPERDTDRLGLVEIGYGTDAPYRGRGYMTEAVGALCGWILAQKNVYGVIAGVLDDNPASAAVLKKNGFVLTDHSDMLSLQVYKKIPEGRTPLSWKARLFR